MTRKPDVDTPSKDTSLSQNAMQSSYLFQNSGIQCSVVSSTTSTRMSIPTGQKSVNMAACSLTQVKICLQHTTATVCHYQQTEHYG